MSTTFTELVTLEKLECSSCAAPYALSSKFIKQRRELGGEWNCPYCQCPQVFRDPDSVSYKRKMEEAEAKARAAKCAEMAERLKREEIESKLSKIKCRVKNGVCPCCNRSFANLKRHMATKHKDFKPKP